MEFAIVNQFLRYLKIARSSGQSTVEYILLMVVVVSLALGVYNSSYFKDFFAEDSSFFEALALQIEHSYRNGLFVEENNLNFNTPHPSFYNAETSKSRFFIPVDVYPE